MTKFFHASVYSHVITRFWPNFGLSDNLPALSHTGFEQQISQYHLTIGSNFLTNGQAGSEWEICWQQPLNSDDMHHLHWKHCQFNISNANSNANSCRMTRNVRILHPVSFPPWTKSQCNAISGRGEILFHLLKASALSTPKFIKIV